MRAKRNLAGLAAGLLVITVVGVATSNRQAEPRPPTSPSAPAAGYRDGRVLVEDRFERRIANGWGEAGAGGKYVVTPNYGSSVADGLGIMDLPSPGTARMATITAPTPADVRASVTMAVPDLPTRGPGIYMAIYLRSDGASGYRADLRFSSDHTVNLTLSRFDGSPKVAHVLAPSKVVASDVEAGVPFVVTFRVVGVTPVRLAASVRQVGVSDPGWQQVVSDPSASRLVAGGEVSLWSYVSKQSDRRRRALYDDFVVTHLVEDNSGRAAPEPSRARTSPPNPSAKVPTASSIKRTPVASSGGSLAVGRAKYAVPAAAIFVSPQGSEVGTGSRASPYRRVQRAVDRARPGAVIVLRGGTYHQYVVLPAGKRLTVQAYPGEKVWFDGSSAVRGWKHRGSVWVVSNWDHDFDASPTYTKGEPDGVEDARRFVSAGHPMAAHPDQVWLGGKQLRQVRSRSAVGRGAFFVDKNRRELVLGSDPRGRRVRASTLQRAIMILGTSDRVRGIGVRRYATSVWQGAAVLVWADEVVLENLVISQNATTGLSVAAAEVRLAAITAEGNGMMGIHGHHADDLSASNLLVARNNLEQFNIAPAAGGMKVTASRRVVLTDGEFSNNVGHGLWFDESSYDVTLARLTARSNVGSGVRVEISSLVLLVGNVVMDNGLDGLRVANTDRVEVANNTFAHNGGRNLTITTDSRRAASQSTPGHDVRYPKDGSMTWVSDDVTVYNNVLSRGGGGCVVCVLDSRRTRPDASTVRFDFNYYQRISPVSPRVFATWPSERPEPLTFLDLAAEQTSTSQDMHSVLNTSAKSAVNGSGALDERAQATASQAARGLTAAAADAAGKEVGFRSLGAWS